MIRRLFMMMQQPPVFSVPVPAKHGGDASCSVRATLSTKENMLHSLTRILHHLDVSNTDHRRHRQPGPKARGQDIDAELKHVHELARMAFERRLESKDVARLAPVAGASSDRALGAVAA